MDTKNSNTSFRYQTSMSALTYADIHKSLTHTQQHHQFRIVLSMQHRVAPRSADLQNKSNMFFFFKNPFPFFPQVSDEELATASVTYPHNSPHTKESYYYRQTFEKYFRGRSAWIPYMWMPKWTKGVTDPSARELTHYKQ